MERLSSAPPPAPKKAEVHKPPPPPAPRPAGPKETAATKDDKLEAGDKKADKIQQEQDASHDYDLALAALHSGDLDSADSLVDKLRRSSQTDPNVYGLAVVQLSLMVQERRDCAQQHKTKGALEAFAKQARASKAPAVKLSVDRSA